MSKEASLYVVSDELRSLTAAMCNGVILPHERDRLEELLFDDVHACEFYVSCMAIHAQLLWRHQGRTEQVIRLAAAEPPKPPFLGFLGNTLHGTFGYFSSGWPVAYLVATVIFGIGLVIGALVHVSQPVQIVKRLPSTTRTDLMSEPQMLFVGRITGMADCQWADPQTEAFNGANVPLGRKYALSSGLMEITYDSGAKVLLQGPVTYEVESRNGGFLPVGKLTGKVEGETAKGLCVRTPTATVTDLGTEFGVEVTTEGNTTSHVFRGSVKLQVSASDGKDEGNAIILYENESARVENSRGQGGVQCIKILDRSAKPTDFVRVISKLNIKALDLADVVAGGDGFSGRRNRGIDPTTGRTSIVQPESPRLEGDYQYHRVEGIPFVDGVFVPDSSRGAVQVDSSGNTTEFLPKTCNIGYGHIWAGASIPGVGPSELDGVDYASPGHGALFLHANKGITFDLTAIRRAYPNYNLLRFRAMAGSTETSMFSDYRDIWVLIDGRVCFRRRQVTCNDGAYAIDVQIDTHNRFLTLASTDGGDGIEADSILFGDPRIEIQRIELQDQSDVQQDKQ
jgi:hypothetical protein